MRDDDQRHIKFTVDATQQVEDLRRRGGVERAGGLIAQHDGRIVGQRPCDGHALLLAAGQLAGVAVGQISQTDQIEQIPRTFLTLGFRRVVEFQREGHVVQHGALLEQAEVLEDHADSGAHVRQLLALHAGDVSSVDEHLAGSGAFQQVDATHQCRFARAGRAENAEDLTRIDGQVNVVQHLMRFGATAVAFVQMVDLNRHNVLFLIVFHNKNAAG